MTLTLSPASNQMILLDNKYLEKSKLFILIRQLVVISFIHTPATQVAQGEQDFCNLITASNTRLIQIADMDG